MVSNLLNSSVVISHKEEILESVIAAASIPFHLQSSTPLDGYDTTYFIETSKDLAVESGLLQGKEAAVSIEDQLLYHAIIYTLSFALSGRDYILPFLSMPVVMRKVCTQNWFLTMKSRLAKAALIFTAKNLKKAAFYYGKKQLNNYLNDYLQKKVLNPLRKLIDEDKSVLLENLRQSCVEALTEKTEAVVELYDEASSAVHDIPSVVRSGIKIHHMERALDRFDNTQGLVGKMMKKPKISPFDQKKGVLSSTIQAKIILSITACASPMIAPFILTSSSPDSTELMIRFGGSVLSGTTDYALVTAFAVEMINKAIPKKYRSKLSALTGQMNVNEVKTRFIESIDHSKKEAIDELKSAGFSRNSIKKISKVVPQTIAANTFVAICMNAHPLTNAFSATSFMEYLGVIFEHHGLLKARSMECENSFMDRFPLHAGVGLGLTALEIFFNTPRPLSSLVCSMISVPLVADKIVSSDFYQTRVITPIKGTIIPGYKPLRQVRLISRVASMAEKSLSGLPGFKTAKIVLIALGTAKVFQKVPVRNLLKSFKETAILTYKVYCRWIAYTAIEHVVGPEIAYGSSILVNRNMKGLISGTVAITVGSVTSNPLASAVAVELTGTMLENNKVKSTFASVKASCSGFFSSIYRKIGDFIEHEAKLIQQSVA